MNSATLKLSYRSLMAICGLVLVLTLNHPIAFAQAKPIEVYSSNTKKSADDPVSRWQGNPAELKKALGEENQIDQFTVQEFAWMDNERNRRVPAKLYWPNPTALTKPQTTQLLIFSHGLGGSRDGYSYIGRYLAQNGIASLHLQHVGSDRAIWSASVFEIPYLLKQAARDEEAINRAKDFQFALTQLFNLAPYAQAINPQTIAAAGHSYGANTTLLVSGAAVERDGVAISLKDPRVKMAVVMSSPPFYGADTESTKKILSSITIPTLHITATEDVINVPGYYSKASDRIQIFENMNHSPKNLVVFKEGSHNIFSDRLSTGGKELNPQVKKASRELILSFIQNQGDPLLLEKNQNWQSWSKQYAGLLARSNWASATQATAQK
jgi:predicted dienelactone hydrolase